MATHSSNLAWRIPWTQKPGRLQSRGLQRVRYDWAITHATHTAQFLGFTVAVVVVAESCLTLCDPMDCSMRGFPVLHHLPKFAQTHVHWVDDAIQPSHALLPLLLWPSIFPASEYFPMSWLFTSGDQSIGTSHQSFQCIFSVNFLWGWLVLSPYPRDSQESSPSPHLESINSSMLSLLYSPSLTSIYDY